MVVYGDLLFLINFSMDFLCFYLSCLLLHRKMNTLRVIFASALGGVYSVLALFIKIGGISALLIDLLVLACMCLLAYGIKEQGFLRFIKTLFLYFFVSALLGGIMTALFSLFNSMDILDSLKQEGDGIDVWIFALLAIVGSLFAFRGGKIYKTSFSKEKVYLVIENEGKGVELCALVDSGNLVTEPISGKGVVFVSVEKCKNIIDETLYDAITNNSYIEDIRISVKYKIRIVPTCSISGGTYLPALIFPKITLKKGKYRKKLDVYIAFVSDKSLGQYDAIISDETII